MSKWVPSSNEDELMNWAAHLIDKKLLTYHRAMTVLAHTFGFDLFKRSPQAIRRRLSLKVNGNRPTR